MKEFEVYEVPENARPNPVNGTPIRTLDVLRSIFEYVNRKEGEGLDVSELRQRNKILDCLERSDGKTVRMEDADYEAAKRVFDGFQFGFYHESFLPISEAFYAAKTIK